MRSAAGRCSVNKTADGPVLKQLAKKLQYQVNEPITKSRMVPENICLYIITPCPIKILVGKPDKFGPLWTIKG